MRTGLIFFFAYGALSLAQERSAIFGVVRDSQTQQPIQGVRLYLMPYNFHPPDPLFPTLKLMTDVPLGFEALTDAAGQYRYPDLPPHRYGITAFKQGYQTQHGPGTIRTVANNDLQCDLTIDRVASISGRFLDATTNAPITGLRINLVVATRAESTNFGLMVAVDKPGKAPGEFEITGLPSEAFYYIEIVPDENESIVVQREPAEASPNFHGRSFYPGVADIGMATPIVLGPGENRQLEIRLPKRQPGIVPIEITAPGDVPEANIELALERKSLPGWYPKVVAKATVRNHDSITLEGLSEGSYTLFARSVAAGAGPIGAVRQFSGSDRTIGQLKLNLEPMLKLKGVVHVDPKSADSQTPTPGGYLYLGSNDQPEGTNNVKITAGTTFEIDGLRPGQYFLASNATPGWVISKMEFGKADAVHQMFTLDDASVLDVTLTRGFGAVNGSLTEGNKPVDNAMVVLVPEPIPEDAWVNSFPWNHLDENGNYEFKFVVPGRYRVIPFYGSSLDRYHDLAAIREHAQGYHDVTVLSGKTISNVNFAIQR
jgi:hypothetical protein